MNLRPVAVVRCFAVVQFENVGALPAAPAGFAPCLLSHQIFPIITHCSQVMVAQKVTTGVYKGVTTSELDELAAETAASLTATHPDYALVS